MDDVGPSAISKFLSAGCMVLALEDATGTSVTVKRIKVGNNKLRSENVRRTGSGEGGMPALRDRPRRGVRRGDGDGKGHSGEEGGGRVNEMHY